MFPADRLPIPVYIYYDSRNKRRRRYFENGLGRDAQRFFAAKMRAGKRPVVKKADDSSLFPEQEGQQ